MKKVTIYFANNNFQMIDSLSMNKVLLLSYWVHKGICVFNVGMILKRGTGMSTGNKNMKRKEKTKLLIWLEFKLCFVPNFNIAASNIRFRH